MHRRTKSRTRNLPATHVLSRQLHLVLLTGRKLQGEIDLSFSSAERGGLVNAMLELNLNRTEAEPSF